MVKRVFAILMWVLLFFFLTLFLVGACAGLFLGGFYLIKGQNNESINSAEGIIGMITAIVTMVAGLVGLFLGVSGKLPWTQK